MSVDGESTEAFGSYDVSAGVPYLIAGVGTLLGFVIVTELILVWVFDFPAPDAYLAGIVTSLPAILGLIYGGYWLSRNSISPDRYGHIAVLCLLGIVIFTPTIVGITALVDSLTVIGYLSTIRWAASIGGGIGLLIGVFNARAIDRAFEAGEARKHQDEIQRELQLYETLFDAVPEPVVRISFDEADRPIVQEVNVAFEDVFGYEEAELQGRDIDEFILPDQLADESEEIKDSTASGELIQREVTRQTASGEREFLFHAKPLDTPGESVEAVGIYVDLAEQKQRERQLKRYETIIDALGDPVYTLDAEGRYTDVNEAFIEQTGYSREEILGKHVAKVVPEEFREKGRTVIRDLLGDEGRRKATWEMKRRSADGDLIPVENNVALLPTEDGEFRGTAGVVRDITERKQRQRELKRQNERLEEFAAVVSHDLRNPLSVAKGRLSLAGEDCVSEHLTAVDRSLDRMETLIEEMLSLAKAGKAVREPEAVELTALLESCWRNVETDSARLITETEATVQADQTRLQQLLENLFRNAIEHGGDDVTVRVGDLRNGFYVEDDGPGIPEDEREDVLQPGYSTNEEGSGFGLGIVRDIAEAHDWQVEVTAGMNDGARFEFTSVKPD